MATSIYTANFVQTSVLSSPEHLHGLTQSAEHLLAGLERSAYPEFFGASLSRQWAPRVVIARDEGEIIGFVYAKERYIGGLPTGMIFGDSTLSNMVIARPHDQQRVFLAAMNELLSLRGVRCLRLLMSPHSTEFHGLRELASGAYDFSSVAHDYHSVLQLPESYKAFVDRLGSRTRRNFRYYRERSEAAGHVYVDHIRLSEFEEIAYSLLKEDVVGASRTGIERALRIFASVDQPLLVGLRAQDGEWLSIIGGWHESNRAVMFLQMNSDRKHARSSLSLVARAHLIQRLVQQRIPNLLFWAGVGDPLNRYVQPIPGVAVYVDKQDIAWRALRGLVNARRNWIPTSLRNWIAVPVAGGSSHSLTRVVENDLPSVVHRP